MREEYSSILVQNFQFRRIKRKGNWDTGYHLGAFNLLGSPLTLLSDFGATDLQGNPISYPTEYFVVTMLSSVIAGAIAIFGGTK